MTFALIVNHDTWLKRSTARSKTLPDDKKRIVSAGTVLLISGYRIVGDHIKVSLGNDAQKGESSFQRDNTWYAFKAHIELLQDGTPLNLLPIAVNLPVFDLTA